jgi:molybdopterin-binding protein
VTKALGRSQPLAGSILAGLRVLYTEPCSGEADQKVEDTMKLSARNQLAGKIQSISPGAVNTEVVVELAGGQTITSVITKASAERLKLQPGMEVYAIIKASNVMIGID